MMTSEGRTVIASVIYITERKQSEERLWFILRNQIPELGDAQGP